MLGSCFVKLQGDAVKLFLYTALGDGALLIQGKGADGAQKFVLLFSCLPLYLEAS